MLPWFSLKVILIFVLTRVCESSKKVRLIDVSTLTLYRDKVTTGRRSSPIPQIQCVGGSAKGQFQPKVVQCYNRGYDGFDVQWECKAEMSDQYEFGEAIFQSLLQYENENIRISCEGYDYPDDPYILQGSCGLKYNLEYSHRKKGDDTRSVPPYEENFDSSLAVLFLLFSIETRADKWIQYVGPVLVDASRSTDHLSLHKTSKGNQRWDGDQGPPPPPGSGRPPPPGFKNFTRPPDAPPTYDEAFYGCSNTRSQSSGPGFFSGLGLGGLAGYMFGRNQNSCLRCLLADFSDNSFFRNRRSFEQDYSYRASSAGPSRRTTSGELSYASHYLYVSPTSCNRIHFIVIWPDGTEVANVICDIIFLTQENP
ncbi:unnamed protein product [Thelazia callipaeda]|uniref:Store-operated calcium entry-associated regulatory factor n=1 Tax=Thelazia callipaeda TaxID=103827 RepID=A0A0N5CK55_THECL|nr:unnamed protein product [Thelazia callipaeda]